jgi:hypothetical protein
MPSHPISLRSILILSIHLQLGLPFGIFPSGFPTNILYAFLFSPIRATCLPISAVSVLREVMLMHVRKHTIHSIPYAVHSLTFVLYFTVHGLSKSNQIPAMKTILKKSWLAL